MILFFYGPNDYLLKQKLRALKNKYKEASQGSFDLVMLEGAKLTADNFLAQTQTMALFSQTRLVVVDQIFEAAKETQDKIKNLLNNLHSQSIVVFTHSGEPDKRLGLFKALNKPKISQYFNNLEQKDLVRFIAKEAREREAIFAPGAQAYLAELTGADPWRLSNEIEKLAVFKDGAEISKEDIDLLVTANIFSNTFAFIDSLINHNRKAALHELDRIISVGEPPLKVVGAINFQIRLIALVKDELERGTLPNALSSKLKSKPYPIIKSIPLAKRLSWQGICRFYEKLVLLDEGIKTGKIVPEEALKELTINL